MVEKHLKLAEGRTVPLEDGKPWPEDGETVEVTHYIRRRLADGDLVEVEETVPASVPAPAEQEIQLDETPGRKPGKGEK